MAGSGTAHLRAPRTRCCASSTSSSSSRSGAPGTRCSAVADVSLDIVEGETLGLVGESGCGKSTTGRAIVQLPRPTSGIVEFDGRDLTALSGEDLRKVRPRMQMIFQDPISSLNPRRRVGDIVAEGLEIWNIGDKDVARREGHGGARGRRHRPRELGAPAPRVLGWAVPAHLDRARRHHRTEAHHLRRAGVRARRVRAGADPQPARGHEGALRTDARVHRARPRGREERQRPRARHVPRQDLRGRRAPRAVRTRPRIPTPRRCSPRSRSPIRVFVPTPRRSSAARSRRRSIPRRAAVSEPGAPRRRPGARRKSRRSHPSTPTAPGTSSPATSRSPRARPSTSARVGSA